MNKIQPKGSFNITIIREEAITLIIVYLFSVNELIIIIGIVEKKVKTTPKKGINICELNKITVNTVKKAVIEICFVI
jgi:phage-related protein